MTKIKRPINFSHICMYCGCEEHEDGAFDFHETKNGFWCNNCEYYTCLEGGNKYNLILEDKKDGEEIKVKKMKNLKKQLSPLRYPGGKSKVIDYLYTKLDLNKTSVFVEVFAGGSSFGLSLLEAGVIDKLIINDLDFGIYSLFKVIKEDPSELIERIRTIEPTHFQYFRSQEIVTNKYKGLSNLDAAWHLLLVNRLAFSGICKANPLGGREGSSESLLQRWNPTELINRIEKIHALKDDFEVLNLDAIELVENYYWDDRGTLFVDPPYVVKGEDLYNHFYTIENHIALAEVIENLNFVAKAADVLITYDKDELIERLYEFPEIENIKRSYSI